MPPLSTPTKANRVHDAQAVEWQPPDQATKDKYTSTSKANPDMEIAVALLANEDKLMLCAMMV